MLFLLGKKKIVINEAWLGPGKKDGEIRKLKPEDDALHVDLKAKKKFEWWYFDARFDNGYTCVVFFYAAHLETGVPQVRIEIYTPEGKKLEAFKDYKVDEIVISEKEADIQFGNNYIKVDYTDPNLPKYTLHAKEGNLSADLSYKNLVEGWIPGKGRTTYGDKDYFAWSVPIPRAEVEGKIKINGEPMNGKGSGYHDHNWGNFDVARAISYWYWGRLYTENFTVIYAYVKTNRNYGSHASKPLMIAKNEKVIISNGEWNLIQRDMNYSKVVKNNYPKYLEFDLDDVFNIKITVNKILDEQSLIQGRIKRFLANKLLRLFPGYFRFNSDFELDLKIDEGSYFEKGTTLNEMVIVRRIDET